MGNENETAHMQRSRTCDNLCSSENSSSADANILRTGSSSGIFSSESSDSLSSRTSESAEGVSERSDSLSSRMSETIDEDSGPSQVCMLFPSGISLSAPFEFLRSFSEAEQSLHAPPADLIIGAAFPHVDLSSINPIELPLSKQNKITC